MTVPSPRIAALAVLASLTAACGDGDAGKATAPPPAPVGRTDAGGARIDFARIAIIGASVSAGFGGAPLANLLDGAVTGPHRIDDAADLFTSRDAVARVRAQVDRALAGQATCVFALDALFWYVYVSGLDGDGRLAELDVGLRELERIDVPLVLGDIPWMRDASPIMIRPTAIPPADQIERFNGRIRAWAAGRPRVLVVPFSDWVTPLLRGEAVAERPGGEPVPAADLMAPDKLHPNRRGALYVLRRVDAAIEAAFPGTAPEALQPR